MNTGDSIKYTYVTTAGSMPVSRDGTTIYFDENTKKISVGDVTFDGGELPTPTSADAGKVLVVNASGNWAIGTAAGGSTPQYGLLINTSVVEEGE